MTSWRCGGSLIASDRSLCHLELMGGNWDNPSARPLEAILVACSALVLLVSHGSITGLLDIRIIIGT